LVPHQKSYPACRRLAPRVDNYDARALFSAVDRVPLEREHLLNLPVALSHINDYENSFLRALGSFVSLQLSRIPVNDALNPSPMPLPWIEPEPYPRHVPLNSRAINNRLAPLHGGSDLFCVAANSSMIQMKCCFHAASAAYISA
jgi:hypothetical protein